MNDFEQRWKNAAARSREAGPDPEPSPPFGFATRVLAQLRALKREASLEQIWMRLGLRALLGMLGLLAVAAVVEGFAVRENDSFLPRVESTELSLPWSP